MPLSINGMAEGEGEGEGSNKNLYHTDFRD